MATDIKRGLYDVADYFQKQADRTRDRDRKAHYQRCADDYRAKAKDAEPENAVNDRTSRS
jgi:hypothetical protein